MASTAVGSATWLRRQGGDSCSEVRGYSIDLVIASRRSAQVRQVFRRSRAPRRVVAAARGLVSRVTVD